MLKSTLNKQGDVVLYQARSILGDLNDFHILLKTMWQIWTRSATYIYCASWAFHTDTNLIGDLRHGHHLDLCGSVGRDSTVTVTVAHLKALQWFHGSFSLWQDQCNLAGQSTAQQSFGAFGPTRSGIWVVCQRGIVIESDRERWRDVQSALLLCSAMRRGEQASKQQQKIRRVSGTPCISL